MRTLALLTVSLCLAVTQPARAQKAGASPSDLDATKQEIQKRFGFMPLMFKAVPESMLPGVWKEMTTLEMGEKTALPGKVKELIGLGVAAQIPCQYCVYAHTQLAKAHGATDAEVGEAIGISALTRHWSTWMNGIAYDPAKFRSELNRTTEMIKKAGPSAAPPPGQITDANSAYKDIEQVYGFVPEFAKMFPQEALPGAWRAMRDLEINPKTALSNKDKELVALAVSAQIPCTYCVTDATTFAKLDGANDAEVREAIAMAALTRQWSTLLNGREVELAGFKRDVNRMAQQTKKAPHAER